MRHRVFVLLACGSLLAALPAAAEVYTIRLSNGATFESRYQPKQASWDKTMVTFLDEAGNEIALPQALVTDVAAQSETKGFGKVINTTTVDLGFAPNDVDEVNRIMERQRSMFGYTSEEQEAYTHSTTSRQFVEPGDLGGVPLQFGGGGGNNFSVGSAPPQPQQQAPAAPSTPAPFTAPPATTPPG
jgi:hypothetical protein